MNKTLNAIVYAFAFVYLFLSSSILNSQTFPYYHYTTKDGLVNANVYYICQDKLGYIWFATNNGLSRFDGNTFQNYYIPDGLNSNSFTSIALGEDSTLYFANFEKGINTYKNGIFSNYEVYPASSITISTMSLRNDTIYIVQKPNYFSVIYNHIFNKSLLYKYNTEGIHYLYPYKNINSSSYKILIGNDRGLFELSKEYSTKTRLQGIGDFSVYKIAEDKYKNLWLGCDGKILKYGDNKVEKTITLNEDIKGKVNKILVDSRGIIWFHPMNKGLYIFKDNEIFDIGNKISLGNTSVNHIYEDKESNVWVSTSGKGVFCFNNIFMSNYFERDGLSHNNIISLLVNNKGEKLIGTFDGLNILEKTKIEKIKTGLEENITDYIYEIKAGIYDNYLVCGSYNLASFERKYRNNKLFFITTFSACQIDSSTFVFDFASRKLNFINYAGNKTLLLGDYDTSKPSWNVVNRDKIKQIQTKTIFEDFPGNLKINEIEKTSDGALWIGTNLGLCKMNGDIKSYYKDDTVLNAKINCIKVNKPGYILIAGEKGFSVISGNPEKIISLEKTEYFDFSSSTSIDVDKDNNIWIGNLKGLYRITLDSFLNGKYNNVTYFNEKTALPSSEVHTVSYDKIKNELWVGTADGLIKMELNDLHNYLQPPPKVLIENIILGDTNLTNFNNLVFKPSQNNIRIHYTSFNFNSPKSIKYEHKLEGERDWTETEYSDVYFNSQPPGKYNLLLRTVNLNNVKGEITSLKFEILAPFWKTIWFYLLIFLLFSALIIFLYFKRVQYIKLKANENLEIQNNISSLRHQALSASLNPHFIFNTLNSIQYYINEHSTEEANKYLVNFSRLIRMNLDLAGNTFISLNKELERLELYMKYEKLRFGENMDYKINIGGNINPEKLEIPNMILQPFVENSIWHGLLNKNVNGRIDINISKNEKVISKVNYPVIEIEILDNGIGLEESIKFKKSNHISKVISIIRDRLNLLAPEIKDFDFITIKDRTDGTQGVIVNIILLPKQYNII